MEAGGVELCALVDSAQLIEFLTRLKRMILRSTGVFVHFLYRKMKQIVARDPQGA